MSYLKQMGVLSKGGAIGHPDYANGTTISWGTTTSPYPTMTDLSGNSWSIRSTWTATRDGVLIGRMGDNKISVNGRWVNQGQADYNGEGFIPVLKGDVVGNSQVSTPDRFYFYPYLGGGNRISTQVYRRAA